MTTGTDNSPAKRVTKRRGQTRQRLLDAAADVFSEAGFGHATVEQICERAGYSRGAFYSNFDSLDELFFAMWEQRSASMLADLRLATESITAGNIVDIHAAVARIVAVVPVDPQCTGSTRNSQPTRSVTRHFAKPLPTVKTRSFAPCCPSWSPHSAMSGEQSSATRRRWDGHWLQCTTAPACSASSIPTPTPPLHCAAISSLEFCCPTAK